MGSELGQLALRIVKCVDDAYWPAIVACEFVDAESRLHTFIGKYPIFSLDDDLDSKGTYPRHGALRCMVLSRSKDSGGRELVRISTAEPDNEESTQGLKEFVVLKSQVSASSSCA